MLQFHKKNTNTFTCKTVFITYCYTIVYYIERVSECNTQKPSKRRKINMYSKWNRSNNLKFKFTSSNERCHIVT